MKDLNDMTPEELEEFNRQGEAIRKYEPTAKEGARLISAFTYHAPKADQIPRYEEIRRRALLFGAVIQVATPPSREQSLALTHLEEVVMWANAAIARNE